MKHDEKSVPSPVISFLVLETAVPSEQVSPGLFSGVSILYFKASLLGTKASYILSVR